MEKKVGYDLHLHTEWSYDALSKVEDYFREAQQRRLRAIAITDHHHMDGYGDVRACAKKYPDVRFIAGGELTVHCPLGTYDLVCLNLPLEETPALAPLWETYHEWQRAFGHSYSVNFVRLGFDFDDDARLKLLQSYRAPRIIAVQGNTHVRYATIRDECIRRGWCADEAAYKKLYASFVDCPDYPEYDIVVPHVKRVGGIVLMAHPCDYFKQFDEKKLDELREMLQLDGFECAQTNMPPEANEFYRAYCKKRGLLSSAGTDIHHAPFDRLGGHGGPDEWLDELLERVTLH